MVEKKKPGKTVPKKAPAAAKPKKVAAPRGGAARETRRRARPAKEEPSAAPRVEASARAPQPPRVRATGIHDLAPSPGSTHYRKRVGRGPGSGHGKTAGRGYKGQKSRTGYRHMRGFEGGQMPLHRRVPKRGFTNIFRVEYDIVNLSDLDRFEAGQAVTPELLAENRLTRRSRPVKILGDGKLAKPLNVSAHKFSASARERIEAAGGRCEVLTR